MKIMLDSSVVYDYALANPKAVGGAERQSWLFARALARVGHEVIVYVRSPQVQPPRVIEGVTFKWAPSAHPLRTWPHMLAAERADWWYWACNDYSLGLLAPMARLYGTRVAFACAFDTDCQPRRALSRRAYLWPLYALGLWSAHRILVQHMGQWHLLPAQLRPKAFWVPYIAYTLPLLPRENYVAWVAVIRQPKRPHLLIEVARKLPQVHFVVCGPVSSHRSQPGYGERVVSDFASCPNIEYRGQVSPAEAQQVISRSALFLSTSEAEGFPNTFLQAWSSAVPVVSVELDPGGTIAQANSGVVAPNIDECALAIQGLLGDRSLNERLGMNGYDYVRQTHSEEACISRLLRALDVDRPDGH